MKRVIVTVVIAAVSLGALVWLNRSMIFEANTSLTVPDVTGMPLVRANTKLHRSELLTGTLEAIEDKAPVGTVLQQNVQPGTQAVPTTPVALIVSAGPDPKPNDAKLVIVGRQCDVQATPPPPGRPKCPHAPLYAAFLFNPPVSPSPAPSPSS
jgi:PASTA domain-containing protein